VICGATTTTDEGQLVFCELDAPHHGRFHDVLVKALDAENFGLDPDKEEELAKVPPRGLGISVDVNGTPIGKLSYRDLIHLLSHATAELSKRVLK
jgi:hypothetical protein